jgi:hypothetical protein
MAKPSAWIVELSPRIAKLGSFIAISSPSLSKLSLRIAKPTSRVA